MFRAPRLMLLSLALLIGSLAAVSVSAQESVQVTSQPDEIAIFYNNVAFVQDTVQLPTGTSVQIALPDQVYAETLIVRENGRRVMNYNLVQENRLLVEWDSTATGDSRQVTLQYLMGGMSWVPKYDLFINGQDVDKVGFDFFAEIHNSTFESENVRVKLIAGSVALNTAYPTEYAPEPAMNQTVAGYADAAPPAPTMTGSTTIQYVYDAGEMALDTEGTQYVGLLSTDLAVRKINLWNANYDSQVYAIYKVMNDSDIPLADGQVHSYQDNIFLGADALELTPISSEGSVTVGMLQNVRVNRTENRTSLNTIFYSEEVNVTLEMSNFSDEAVTIDVVDYYPTDGRDYTFSQDPEKQGDNLYRWSVTIPAGETQTITYKYKI
jgi:hypothetical protein